MNRVIEYKNFLITITEDDYIDENTGDVIFKRYMSNIIGEKKNTPYRWFKDYDRTRHTVQDVIEEAKFHIDEWTKDRDKFKITITLRTPVNNPKLLMNHLCNDIKNTLSDYDIVKLEKIEAFDKDKALVDGVLYKNEED